VTDKIFKKLKIEPQLKPAERLKMDDDQVIDDEDMFDRGPKIQSLRPQTNFGKFENNDDLKERTGSIFSPSREPRKAQDRKTMESANSSSLIIKSRSPTQLHSRFDKLLATDHASKQQRKSSGPQSKLNAHLKAVLKKAGDKRPLTVARSSALISSIPPEPAFINFDHDTQLRAKSKMPERGLSIGQIQMQLAMSGRNGCVPLLNHTSVKQDAKRDSMALANVPVFNASLSINRTKTPASRHPGP
jgi:hypothetical protein